MGLRTWCMAPSGRICVGPAGSSGADKSREGEAHGEAVEVAP